MRTFEEHLKYLQDRKVRIAICHAETDEEANEFLDFIEESEATLSGLGFDTETTGLNPESDNEEVRLIQLALRLSEFDFVSYTFDVWTLEDATLERIELLLGSTECEKIGQNLKFDVKFVKKRINPEMRFGKLFDTMLANQLLSFGHITKYEHSLKAIAEHWLQLKLDKSEALSDWSKTYLDDEQLQYAGRDAVIPYLVRDEMYPVLEENKLWLSADNIFSAIEPVAKLEYDGFYLEESEWRKEYIKTLQDIQETQKNIYQLLPIKGLLFDDDRPFNLGSSKQVSERLKMHGIDLPQTEAGNDSKNKAVLAEIVHLHPAIALLIKIAELNKLESSYGLKWFAKVNKFTKRIHATFNIIWALTSRMSCFNPNLQQIPRGDSRRSCFRAMKGYKLVAADYSQIELRILANNSRDEKFIEGFCSGKDFHTMTAAQLFEVEYEDVTPEQRQFAKTLNFMIVYGGGKQKLAYMTGITEDEAEEYLYLYFETYKGAKAYLDKLAREAVRYKRSYTACGFIAKYYFNRTDKRMKSQVERNGKNMPIQGTSADITRRALRVLFDELCKESLQTVIKLVNVIHDEIILEAPEELQHKAAEILERALKAAGEEFITRVPVKVDVHIGDVWKK